MLALEGSASGSLDLGLNKSKIGMRGREAGRGAGRNERIVSGAQGKGTSK